MAARWPVLVRHFIAGTRYASHSATAQSVYYLKTKEFVMLEVEMYNHDANADPPVSFATDAEIEIADRLRRQLEERYLTPSAPSSPSQPGSGKGG
jgi:hypothetical protein